MEEEDDDYQRVVKTDVDVDMKVAMSRSNDRHFSMKNWLDVVEDVRRAHRLKKFLQNANNFFVLKQQGSTRRQTSVSKSDLLFALIFEDETDVEITLSKPESVVERAECRQMTIRTILLELSS